MPQFILVPDKQAMSTRAQKMTKAKAAARDRPYHRGDLHRAIVSAALNVLHETHGLALQP